MPSGSDPLMRSGLLRDRLQGRMGNTASRTWTERPMVRALAIVDSMTGPGRPPPSCTVPAITYRQVIGQA